MRLPEFCIRRPVFATVLSLILILVGVGLDTSKQIESQLMLRNYEGFLR